MLSRWSLLPIALLALAGTATACEGLSPGDRLDIPGAICTLGFLVANADDLYFTTAGHCIQNGEPAGSPDIGGWGTGVFHYLQPETGSETDGSPGMDFALIRIEPGFYDRLNPKMCGWDGPTGFYDDASGEGGGVKQYGHGLIFGDLGPTTQKRQGTALNTGDDDFYWVGPGVPGDSGGAVLAEDGRALGVLTHLSVGLAGTNGGTRLDRGFRLAAEEGFVGLRLVLAGESPIEVLEGLRGTPTPTPKPGDSPMPPTAAGANGTAPPPASGNTTAPSPAQPTAPSADPTQDEGDSIEPAQDEGEPTSAPPKTPFLTFPLVAALAVALALALRKR